MLQCTKVLQCAQRRKRIGARRRAEIVGELGELPVRVSHEGADFVTIDRPAPSHGLSAYDAADLEIALRRSLVQLPDTYPTPLDEAALLRLAQ